MISKPWRSYSYGDPSPCTCGSGKDRAICKDALGNFVTYFCEDCEDQQLSSWDPSIWTKQIRYEECDW